MVIAITEKRDHEVSIHALIVMKNFCREKKEAQEGRARQNTCRRPLPRREGPTAPQCCTGNFCLRNVRSTSTAILTLPGSCRNLCHGWRCSGMCRRVVAQAFCYFNQLRIHHPCARDGLSD